LGAMIPGGRLDARACAYVCVCACVCACVCTCIQEGTPSFPELLILGSFLCLGAHGRTIPCHPPAIFAHRRRIKAKVRVHLNLIAFFRRVSGRDTPEQPLVQPNAKLSPMTRWKRLGVVVIFFLGKATPCCDRIHIIYIDR